MRSKYWYVIVNTMLFLCLPGCATKSHNASAHQGITKIEVSGNPGVLITGFYVQKGQRHEITGSLPFNLTETGLSECEIRKVNPKETFTLVTRQEGPERHSSFANMTAGPGVPGVRVELRKGFSVESLKK